MDPNSATLKVPSRQKNILQSVRATKGNTQPLIVGKPKALNEKDFRVRGKASPPVVVGNDGIMVGSTQSNNRALAMELYKHKQQLPPPTHSSKLADYQNQATGSANAYYHR